MDYAKHREKVLKSCSDVNIRANILKRCKKSFLFWCRTFAFTFDPRKNTKQFFILWPKQVKLVNRVIDKVSILRHNGRKSKGGEGRSGGPVSGDRVDNCLSSKKYSDLDLLVEKSRDVGATWTLLALITWYWLFHKNFSALLGSRTEYCVDKAGDMDTLFERIRFILKWLPGWMLPEGFSWYKHSKYMTLINDESTNIITGQAASENFGRQGRNTIVLMDEFAVWPQDEESWTSVSAVSPVKMVVSTVGKLGRRNCFGRLRWKSEIDKFIMEWTDNPDKPADFIKTLEKSGKMTLDKIAREYLRSYEAGSGRPYYTEFKEDFIVPGYEVKSTGRILRGWDFSYHHPACCFMQQDNEGGLTEFFELLGNDLYLADFILIVKYVSGESLEQGGIDRVRYLVEQGKIENVLDISHLPKFSCTDYKDYCDIAGNQKSDKSKMTSIQMMSSMGIHPLFKQARIDEGANALRKLMLKDQYRITRNCVVSVEGFKGGYHYCEKMPDKAEKDGYYDHLMDCRRYVIQQIYSFLADKKVEVRKTRLQRFVEAGMPEDFARAFLGENVARNQSVAELRAKTGQMGY